MEVKKIMSEAITQDENISLKKASEIMGKKNVSCLLMTKKNKLVGILTQGDITRNLSQSSKSSKNFMSKNLTVIDAEENLDTAAKVMTEKKIKKLPVLDESGALVGVITSTDLIEHSDELSESFIFE